MITASGERTIIFPPAGSGSKGDEGMLRGALRLFPAEEVVVINPEVRTWRGEIDDVCEFDEVYYDQKNYKDLIGGDTTVVFVGADVIDGSAGIPGSLLRLDAVEMSMDAGARVFVFFSYRSDIDSEIKSRLEKLTKSPRIYFFLRDESSLKRFQASYQCGNAYFFPDLAFFSCEIDAYTEKRLQDGRKFTIGLNFSEQSFRATRAEINDENRRFYIKENIDSIVSVFPDANFCLIANDIRMWHGFWSDYDYAVECQSILAGLNFAGEVGVISPIASYKNNIQALRTVDILIAGRMHLAIASFIAWTLPIVVTGKSFESKEDLKQRGMYDKAAGMLEWCFGRSDCVVTSSLELRALLEDVRANGVFWQQQISDNRIILQRKIKASLDELRGKYSRTASGPSHDAKIASSVFAALKSEKFDLEIERRNNLQELEIRGLYIRHLQEELHAIKNSVEDSCGLEFGIQKPLSAREFPTASLGENQESETEASAPGPNAFFTICAKNFLAHARALHDSIQPHYPDARFFVVLCDRVDGLFDPVREPFEFIYLEELKLPNLADMANRYNITEFNTSVKPFAFLRLMQDFQFDSVVYLDPDLFFVDRMLEIDQLLADGAEAILTPHILEPAEQDQIHDRNMLQFGIYNLGFLALRNTPSVQAFLQWWGRRLEKDCVIRLEDGLFVDQKWADLLPAFVPGAKILHHPGYNVAYWNLPQRNITKEDSCWFANGQPLRFVHFSGNKLDDVTTFSRHSQQVTIENIGILRELLDTYQREVYKQGHAFYRSLPYAYSWVGVSGVNLHTPQELDLATQATQKPSSAAGAVGVAVHQNFGKTPFRRRYSVMRQAVPVAKRLSGGWVPFVRRAWSVYRQHGWHYLKAKAVELSGYKAPPSMPMAQQANQANAGIENPKRLLYLDWAIPKPDQDAASVTAVLLLQIFETIGYKVTFVPCSLKYEEGYYEDLAAAKIDVIVYPAIQSVKEWLQANAANYDVCVMARGPVVWPYLETIKACAPNLRLIFNTVDLHYLRELRQAELANDQSACEAAVMLREQELELIDKCDLTILLSNEELYTVRELRKEAPLTVLPVVFREIPGAAQGYEQRRDILFIGSFPHKPNIDAVVYFAESIFPIVKRQIPEISFKVIGANPPEEIRRLAAIPGIEILGFVKDLDPIFTNIRLTVAPIRYGAGIKGKIGTSLCYGVPCVATPMAVEGMGLTPGLNVLIAESSEAFADVMCDVYRNAELWQLLSSEGHKFALANYSVEVITERVRNILFSVNNGWHTIHNVVEVDSSGAFKKHSARMEKEYERRALHEQTLLPADGSNGFRTPGFCCACGTSTRFLTSFMYSTGNAPDGRPMPNWREHMQCEHCGLVNRMRAALNALHTYAPPDPSAQIYITEKLTTTYQWLSERYPKLQGSEYFGPTCKPGSLVDGIRHEDVMNLSFAEDFFDRVLSFDVLEHVPDPERAFREIFRVLKPGGVFIFSVPFSSESSTDIVRASLEEDGSVTHHLTAEYHGNPVDPEGGALCFRYFGWEMLDNLRSVGFKSVRCLAYWSEEQGYLGREQYLFIMDK